MPVQQPVNVLTVLSPELLAHVRLRAPKALTPKASTGREVERALGTSLGLLVIVDPSSLHPDAFGLLMRSAAQTASRVLLYGRLSGVFAERVLDAEKIMLVGLAIAGPGDDQPLCRCLVDLAAVESMQARVLRGVAHRVDRLTPPLSTAVVGLFAGLAVPRSADDFYMQFPERAAVTLRRIHEAGFSGAHEVLTGTRLCHAWASLRNSKTSFTATADRYGFGAVRTLSDNCVLFTGLPPRMATKQLSAEEFARCIVARLQPDEMPLGR